MLTYSHQQQTEKLLNTTGQAKKNEREILYGTEVFDSDVGPVTVVSNNEASRTLF